MSFEALSDMYRGEPISPIGKPQDKSSEENIKRLKRKTIGFFRNSGVVSLEKLSQSLVDSGIVRAVDEGKKLIPILDGTNVWFHAGDYTNHLAFRGAGDGRYQVG